MSKTQQMGVFQRPMAGGRPAPECKTVFDADSFPFFCRGESSFPRPVPVLWGLV